MTELAEHSARGRLNEACATRTATWIPTFPIDAGCGQALRTGLQV